MQGLTEFRYLDGDDENTVRSALNNWISFFAGACLAACEEATKFEEDAQRLQDSWRKRLGQIRKNSALDLLLEEIVGMPLFTVKSAASATGRAISALEPAIQRCIEAGIVKQVKNAEEEVTFACEQFLGLAEGYYDPEKIVGIKCLGRMEESLLVLLARAGARRIVLVRGACESCEHICGSKTATLVCKTANTLLEAWNQAKIVSISDKLPSATRKSEVVFDTSHRDFLTDMLDSAKSTVQTTADYAVTETFDLKKDKAAPVLQKVQEDDTLPHFLPHRRNRLLKGLTSFGEPQDIMIDTRLWGHVIIDTETCTSCQMCATFCPTEAIKKFKDDDGSFGIKHYPSRCVKCSCCASICPAGALGLSDEVFAVDLISKSYERYEMKPRQSKLGPHQMKESIKGLLNDEYIYER